MGDFLTNALGTIMTQIVEVVMGLFITAATTIGGFYLKRFGDNIKKKSLWDEVYRYVEFAEKARSYSEMNMDEKIQTIFEKAREFADENKINVSDKELLIRVESTVCLKQSLELIGERVLKLSRTYNPKGED